MGVPPINNHYILLLIYLKSAYSGALVHTVSPYVIPCYYMLIYVLCQVFFDEIAIFFTQKCLSSTISRTAITHLFKMYCYHHDLTVRAHTDIRSIDTYS